MNATGTRLVRYIRTLAAAQADNPCTDQQLLEQFATQREQASFAALVRRYGPMVLGVCRRVLGHDQDAEDAFQATFLVLANKAGSIRKQESISSWLHGVAYHVAEKLRAKEARRVVHERKAASRLPVDPAEEVAWGEIRCLLDSELARLPERYRGPLVLCYLQGRTQDEAARQLEWSLSTLRRRLDQARSVLACRLRRRGLALSAALTAPVLLAEPATAELSPLLAAATVRTGLASALGNTVSGIVSSQVVALAESGAGSLLSKKASIVLVLLASLMLGMGGLLAHRAAQDRTFAEAPAAPSPQSPPARSANKEQAIDLQGRVLDPDGKPVAGARLLLSSWSEDKDDPKVSATARDDGRFHLSVPGGEIRRGAKLVALARNLGPDWVWIDGSKSADNITLRLVPDDIPIAGRVLDLEGQPVSGASVRISWVDEVDLKPWLADPKPVDLFGHKTKNIRPAALDVPISVTTDKDGRFRLTGFGRDRIVHLRIRGAGIENNDIEVMARTGNLHGLRLESRTVYASGSTIVVRPSKPIVGTIRDKKTGKPIAGIQVIHPDGNYDWARATTDDKGHYRLEGVGKQKAYSVAAGGLPYFNLTKMNIADTPGLESITVDFTLERGVVVRGKLLDKVTGQPIRGRVGYLALPDNPNLKDFADLGKPQFIASDPGRTKDDGSFTVLAIPGPGVLNATADDDLHYLRTETEVPKSLGGSIPEQWHTLVPIAPSEEDAQSTVRDIILEPARSRNGTVVGPDGKPLAGARYAGLSSIVQLHFGRDTTMETASFTVGGLAPKGSRNLVFIHAEKKLAKIESVRGADEKPLTVRLEPMGTLTGRILDANGQPRSQLQVAVMLPVQREDYKDLPLEILYDYPAWAKILNREVTTDAEGRFRAEALVPGLKYLLNVKEDGAILDSLTREVAVESSKTKDLGNLKIKPASKSEAKEKP